MHFMTAGAPGLVDLLVLLDAHRGQCKPDEALLALCEDFIKAASVPTASESREVCSTQYLTFHAIIFVRVLLFLPVLPDVCCLL
jgi:hypothetical protein